MRILNSVYTCFTFLDVETYLHLCCNCCIIAYRQICPWWLCCFLLWSIPDNPPGYPNHFSLHFCHRRYILSHAINSACNSLFIYHTLIITKLARQENVRCWHSDSWVGDLWEAESELHLTWSILVLWEQWCRLSMWQVPLHFCIRAMLSPYHMSYLFL